MSRNTLLGVTPSDIKFEEVQLGQVRTNLAVAHLVPFHFTPDTSVFKSTGTCDLARVLPLFDTFLRAVVELS